MRRSSIEFRMMFDSQFKSGRVAQFLEICRVLAKNAHPKFCPLPAHLVQMRILSSARGSRPEILFLFSTRCFFFEASLPSGTRPRPQPVEGVGVYAGAWDKVGCD